MAGRKIATTQRRVELRDHLWPSVKPYVYPPVEGDKGWCMFPRVMPNILELMSQKEISGGTDLTRTYLGLWCDNYGDGLVEIDSELTYAMAAGFKGARGIRSWRDRVRCLEKWEFIKVAEGQTAGIGFVCILDPRYGVYRLKANGYTPSPMWRAMYLSRLVMTGASKVHIDDASYLMDVDSEDFHKQELERRASEFGIPAELLDKRRAREKERQARKLEFEEGVTVEAVDSLTARMKAVGEEIAAEQSEAKVHPVKPRDDEKGTDRRG